MKHFIWPDFDVNFISIKNLSICSLQFKPGWSLNLGSTLQFFAHNWILSRNCKWLACINFTLFVMWADFECSQDGKHGKGQFTQWYASQLPVAPCSTPAPYFSHWKFSPQHLYHSGSDSILKVGCMPWDGGGGSGDRSLNSRKPRVKNAETFSAHLHPSNPLSALFAQVLNKCIARAH